MKRSARLALVWQSLRTAGDDFSSVASTTSLDTTQTYRKGAVLRNLFLLFQPLLACENIYLLQVLVLAWTSMFVWFSSFQAAHGLLSRESTERFVFVFVNVFVFVFAQFFPFPAHCCSAVLLLPCEGSHRETTGNHKPPLGSWSSAGLSTWYIWVTVLGNYF